MPADGVAQDTRSLAYVMIEMLTGMRVRGHLLERERLLSLVASEADVDRDFVLELLRSSSLRTITAHPYIGEREAWRSPSASGRDSDEPQAVAILVEQELAKCREMRRCLRGEIRTWLAQFERRNERKPNASERPRALVVLQHRCRLLSERVRAIEVHLAVTRQSFFSRKSGRSTDSQGDDDDEQVADLRVSGSPISSPRRLNSTVGVLPAIDVSTRTSSLLSDAHRRSPAQHAFLKRLEAPTTQPDAVADDEGRFDSKVEAIYSADIVTERVTGHHIIHQRREVMQVISTIASADNVSSSSDAASRQ